MTQPLEGIQWPITDEATQDRASTKTSLKIWSDSFMALDKKVAQDVLEQGKSWRFKYAKYILKHVELSLKSPENALQAAKAGLQSMHEHFQFIRDGKSYKFSEALQRFNNNIFEVGKIIGNNPKPANKQYEVPYRGRSLKGEELVEKLRQWSAYGTIEPDTQEAITAVVKNSKWIDLSDQYFVLLGAGAAMGPYPILMSLGANVIALDIDRPHVWKRLISIAENSCGTLYFPLKKKQSELSTNDQIAENAGCNLMNQTPEINAWLSNLFLDKDLIVGTYVYLDGELHVRVALACDAIVQVN